MVYKYKGINKEGKKAQGTLEAPTLEDAKKRLKGQGILYESVKQSGQNFFSRFQSLRTSALPVKILSNFSRNLAIYLRAGVPIVQALRLQTNNVQNQKLGDFLTAIETMIEEGKSFHAALESQKIITLPHFYIQSIKVAEDNGLLDKVLIELSSFLKNQEQMSKQVKKALTYPLFIVMISVLMVGVMLTVVVPKITEMFDQMKQEVPPLTKFVITSGDFVSAHWILILIAFFSFAYAFATAKKKVPAFKMGFDNFMLKIPLFGKLIRTSELARFSYISSMLLRSGVPFVHTVRLASNIIENAPLQKIIALAARYVVEGKKFSQALVKAGFHHDKAFLQSIALGEETSELPQMLENLSELYAEDNKDTTDMFLALLEPVLILFVGLIMGVIVAAMLLPIFSLQLGGVS